MPTTLAWQPYGLSCPPSLGARAAHCWLIPLSSAEVVDSTLDAEERRRAARFVFARDRDAFVASHRAMRAILAGYLEMAPADIVLHTDAYGKPRLAPDAGLDFNLSHSRGLALIGVTRGARIGVDVEMARPLPDRDALIQGNFASAECTALAAMPESERDQAFFATWTRKEAVVKALGQGLSFGLDRFVVSTALEDAAALLSIDGNRQAAAAWTLLSTPTETGAWVSAAVDRADTDIRLFRPDQA